MPYFVYKITPGPTELLKDLQKIEEFDSYRDAKQFVKAERNQLPADCNFSLKVIFAGNALQAEEQLMEKREAPILQEWEK